MLEFKFSKTSLFPPPTGGSEPSPARARPPAGQGRREGEEHHAVLQQVLHTVILLPGRDGGGGEIRLQRDSLREKRTKCFLPSNRKGNCKCSLSLRKICLGQAGMQKCLTKKKRNEEKACCGKRGRRKKLKKCFS